MVQDQQRVGGSLVCAALPVFQVTMFATTALVLVHYEPSGKAAGRASALPARYLTLRISIDDMRLHYRFQIQTGSTAYRLYHRVILGRQRDNSGPFVYVNGRQLRCYYRFPSATDQQFSVRIQEL